MMLYPEAQRKAQEELDRIVGTDRLPNLEDIPNLVYLDALWKELLRWNPVDPLGTRFVTTILPNCSRIHVFLGRSLPSRRSPG